MKIKVINPFSPSLKIIKSERRNAEIQFEFSIKNSKVFFFVFCKAMKGMAAVLFKDITSTPALQEHLPRAFRKRKMRNRYKAKFVEIFHAYTASHIEGRSELIVHACQRAVWRTKDKMERDIQTGNQR